MENNILFVQSSQVRKHSDFWYCCAPKSAYHNYLIYSSFATILPSQALFSLLQSWGCPQSPIPISSLHQGRGVPANLFWMPSLSGVATQHREELSYLTLSWDGCLLLLCHFSRAKWVISCGVWKTRHLPESRSCCALFLALADLGGTERNSLACTCQHEFQIVSQKGKATFNLQKHS